MISDDKSDDKSDDWSCDIPYQVIGHVILRSCDFNSWSAFDCIFISAVESDLLDVLTNRINKEGYQVSSVFLR